MILREPIRYFPVTPRYEMPGRLLQFGDRAAGEGYLEVDNQLERYRAAKRAAVRTTDTTLDEDMVASWLGGVMGSECPDLPRPAEFPASPTLADLVSLLQEDLVVMQRSEGTDPSDARAVYLHVSIPSGWCPRCVVGKNFEHIHHAVPRADKFTEASRRSLGRVLYRNPAKRSEGSAAMVRFAWGLTADAALDRRACRQGHESAERTAWPAATEAFLRVERQVVVPLDERHGVFLIRIHVCAFSSLAGAQREILRENVRSMSEDVATYKGLHADRARILELLEASGD